MTLGEAEGNYGFQWLKIVGLPWQVCLPTKLYLSQFSSVF